MERGHIGLSFGVGHTLHIEGTAKSFSGSIAALKREVGKLGGAPRRVAD
jgi:hypothetical protein